MASPIFANNEATDRTKQLFIQECEDMLKTIDPTRCAEFEDNYWHLPFTSTVRDRGEKLAAKLDFSDFDKVDIQFRESFLLLLEPGKEITLTPIGFAKWLFLKVCSNNVVSYRFVWQLENIKLLFMFLKERNSLILNEESLVDFYSLLLNYDFKNGKLIRRFSAPAHASRFKFLHLREFARVLRIFDIDGVVADLTHEQVNRAFNQACLAQMDMTLSDYSKGGSFDFLTLDVGRHYVDYCADFYEKNISFATALSKSLQQLALNVNEKGNAEKWEEVFDNKNLKSKNNVLQKLFFANYNDIVCERVAFNMDNIYTIANRLDLDSERLDTYEFIRSLLYEEFNNTRLKKRTVMLAEYLDSLNSESSVAPVSFSIHDFDRVCDEVLSGEILDETDSVNLVLAYVKKYKLTTCQNISNFFFDVESAGITTLVALTGWRSCEYGFPLRALHQQRNKDFQDAVFTPFRFFIKWKSPKGNGDTLLKREVTLSTAILIRHLNAFTSYEHNGYALTQKRGSSEISRIVYNAVTRLWFEFPHQYKVFLELDELQKFDVSTVSINSEQSNHFLTLSNKYNLNSPIVKNLISLKDKLRSDVKLQELTERSYSINNSTVRFKETLSRYMEGSLAIDDIELLENNLSQDTLAALKSSSLSLTADAVSNIRNELLTNTYYATPHALRHIWAEAVLRRYRGDVGKFIRANFKHIDERFFMAYLRNKSERAIMNVAERNTINSIVQEHINNFGNDKRAYAGGLTRYVDKAITITRVKTQAEYEALREDIPTKRIISLKSMPWTSCLLRKGTRYSAKCSVNGVLERYNSSPKLCLGCINADITEGNYSGIVIYIKPDVEACRNSKVPAFLKSYHLATVNLALKRIQELCDSGPNKNKYIPFINFLRETMEIANLALRNNNV